MTKATLSLPSPKAGSSRQKKKPCPPRERGAFRRISAEFTGGAASGKRRSPRTRFEQEKKQNKTKTTHKQNPTNQKTQINTPNQTSKPKATRAEQPRWQTSQRVTCGGAGQAEPRPGHFPHGKVPLKIKPCVGKRGAAGSCPVIAFIRYSNIDFLLVSKVIGNPDAGLSEVNAI